MVVGNEPSAVGEPLYARSAPAQRLQPTKVSFSEGLARSRIVLEVNVDAVPPIVSGGNFSHDPISRSRLNAPCFDPNDRAH
jgi:hypothetical protein